jgi:translational activator of cytochrome c oxidase 1
VALNAPLANILKRAKADGVPKDVIERAMAKVCIKPFYPFCWLKRIQARGEKGKGSQPVTYEAMAAGSVGVIMCVLAQQTGLTHAEGPQRVPDGQREPDGRVHPRDPQ